MSIYCPVSNDIIKNFINDKNCFNDPNKEHKRPKISLVGCGQLGGTCIASLIYTNLPANIVLIEPIESNFGIEQELFQSLSYCEDLYTPVQISCSTDISASANSDIVLIALDCTRNRKQLKISKNLIYENVRNFYIYIPKITKLSPNCILVLLTFPFTLFTQICYKIAKIPKNRIIGVGTSLLTSEFEKLIADKFNISPNEVEGYIIGLNIHRSKIAIWSTASVCGIPLNSLIPFLGTEDDPLELFQDLKTIERLRTTLFAIHGPPRWTVSLLCAKFCNAILRNTLEVFPVPVNIKGMYDITKTCCVSVPCSIGRNGIHSIISLTLNAKEKQQLYEVAYLSNKMLRHYIFETHIDVQLLNLIMREA